MVKVSVPGKCIIIGEHAVVYGTPAIIAAIGRRTVVEAEKAENIRVSDPEMGPDLEWGVQECKEAASQAVKLWEEGLQKKDFSEVFSLVKGSDFKKVAIGHALNKLGIDSGVSLKVSGNVPVGAGVGSSAALAAALVKAVSEVYEKPLGKEELNSLVFEIEQFKHGTPSGGDNAACCFGGLIWFQKGDPNTIDSLKEEIPYSLENVVLVYTGKPEKSTGELVQDVRGLDPSIRDPAVEAIGKAALEMRTALKGKDFDTVQSLIDLTQQNLKQFGVSTPAIDRIVERVREIGGAAKLCGAGGGGTMLCYHKDKEQLIKTIKELGFEPLEAELGVEGVRVEG
ncbi:MAG: mevalonate kinase [Candidatus Aenigmarchaeota archaeon]|nr:mevalonate kinase [Candidatus Aenigmarchaeota archaeon]